MVSKTAAARQAVASEEEQTEEHGSQFSNSSLLHQTQPWDYIWSSHFSERQVDPGRHLYTSNFHQSRDINHEKSQKNLRSKAILSFTSTLKGECVCTPYQCPCTIKRYLIFCICGMYVTKPK